MITYYCQFIECRKQIDGKGIKRDGIRFCSKDCADKFEGKYIDGAVIKNKTFSAKFSLKENKLIHSIISQIKWAKEFNEASVPQLRLKLITVIMEQKKKAVQIEQWDEQEAETIF